MLGDIVERYGFQVPGFSVKDHMWVSAFAVAFFGFDR